MNDYLVAGWRTAKVAAAVAGIMLGLIAVVSAIGLALFGLFYLIGGETALNILMIVFWGGMFIWLFVLPIIDLFKTNLRRIRNERNKDAQISID